MNPQSAYNSGQLPNQPTQTVYQNPAKLNTSQPPMGNGPPNQYNAVRPLPPPPITQLQSNLVRPQSPPATMANYQNQINYPQYPAPIPPVSNINQLIPNLQNITLNPPPQNNNLNQPLPRFVPPLNNNLMQPTPSLQNQPQQMRPMYPPQLQPKAQQQQPTQMQSPQFNHQVPATAMQYGVTTSTQPSGYNRPWSHPDVFDLMQNRNVLTPDGYTPPKICLNNQFSDSVNCDPSIFRSTITKIPETKNLLEKSRLPLGILIHPFRDLVNLPVVSCSQIVRCRACRTYINPFVYFVDTKKWKCNLCFRVNELPEEFQYDPVTKTYGDVTRRPEVRSSTIEFIAPSEYMLRPPQPAVYLFLLDVSQIAVQSGYLGLVCDGLAENLDNLPGDARTQVGFIAYNSAVHFYSIAEGFNRPHEITILELEDIFLPQPDNLLINLKDNRELINDLLDLLPKRFDYSHDPGSALGAALQVSFKMMMATGGRVTVFQTCLPNKGPGALQPREDPNNRSSTDVNHLGPATDFYKKLALEYSGQQIAVDLFVLNSQYSDLATLSGISKFSGGCVYHFPLFNAIKKQDSLIFRKTFERYLTRKIGFEAVMRVRCTRGLQIHSFHGNFFVRSTDLLSLPNINPDAGFAMQISYEESLTDLRAVCFQAALLYTSSKGERRIRVHTLCLPVTSTLIETMNAADTQAIIGLLTKMAVDRSIQSNLSDARDAFINATIDIFSAYRVSQNLPQISSGQLQVPRNLGPLPLYILALLKNVAFRTGTSTRLDDRTFAMCEMKTLPLDQLMKYIYPDYYKIDCLFDRQSREEPQRLQLTAEQIDSRCMFLMDCGTKIILFVGSNIRPDVLKNVIGVELVNQIHDLCFDLQTLETDENKNLHAFIDLLNEEKPFPAVIQIIRDNSTSRPQFIGKLTDDRTDSSLSYYEFLQHLRTQVK